MTTTPVAAAPLPLQGAPLAARRSRAAAAAWLVGALLLPVGTAACAQTATAASASSAAQGKSLYTSFCARCHGVNMVTTGTSFDLRSFPRDQRERFERSVTQGVRAMPAWGTTFKPDELESLWLYVSTGGSS